MKIFRDIKMNVPRHQRGVALGTFDGVHLGHQALIAELLKDAKVSGRIPAIFTFSDHPDLVFRDKDTFQGLIMSVEEKIETFAALGVEEVFLMPLVPELYKLSAEEFLQDCMLKKLNAGFIAVGEDAKFGSDRGGDAEYLLSWSKKHDVQSAVIEDIYLAGSKVSSTRIRKFLKQGEVDKANTLIGRNFGFKVHQAVDSLRSVYKLDFCGRLSEQDYGQAPRNSDFSAPDGEAYHFSYPDEIVPLPEGKYHGQVYFQSSEQLAAPAELKIKKKDQGLIVVANVSVPCE